jgi:hypothetical protein
MLDLEAFNATELCREPFDFMVVPGFLKAEALAEVNADFPSVSLPGSFPLSEVRYGPGFAQLIEELRSDDVREAFGKKFGIDLTGRPSMFTVRSQCCEKDGRIHTDSTTKIITILLYMNPRWEDSGGRLRLLRSASDLEDCILEVPPDEGTLLCFRRSENSWHGHKPFVGPRRVVQMNYVVSQKVVNYEQRRHRVSAVLKKLLRRAS